MLKDIKLINLPKISDERGHLTFLENYSQIPFAIQRVYYLYDVPLHGDRGGHAHKALHQLIVPICGSFKLRLHDGFEEKTYQLAEPSQGLYICPMIWRNLTHFSPGSVCIVFASELYDSDDYIRDYDTFLKLAAKTKL